MTDVRDINRGSVTNSAKIFLSYSRRDRARVADLGAKLEAQDDLTVFRDTEDILPTEEWKPRLEALIRKSDTVLFALSPASVASEICAWEIDLALALNKRIIPVVVDDVDGNVPEAISKLNYIFLTPRDDFEAGISKIRDAIYLDIDWIREHTRVAELANRWAQAQRLGAQPLRGKELEAVEHWLMTHPVNAPAPTEEQRSFIRDSRMRAKQRRRIGVGVAAVAFAVVSAMGLLAWQQRNKAVASDQAAQEARIVAETEKRQSQKSESRFVARRAMELLDRGATEDALALALRSLPQPDIPDDRPVVKEAELAAIRAFGGLQTQNLVEFDQKIETIAFAKNDEWALLGGFRLGLKLFDLKTNRVLHSFEARKKRSHGFEASLPIAGGVISLAVHPSNRMAVTGGEGALRFWSLRDGHQYFNAGIKDQTVEQLAFSPDGKVLVTQLSDGRLARSTIYAWRHFETFPQKARAFWISEDSKYLLVQHRRPKTKLGDNTPPADDVFTTYDLARREPISTRSFPRDEASVVALVPGRGTVFILGKNINRELDITDLTQERRMERPEGTPRSVQFSKAGDAAIVEITRGPAQLLRLGEQAGAEGPEWQPVIYPKRRFSASAPPVHVPEIYGDQIGFLADGRYAYGLDTKRQMLRVDRVASEDNAKPARLELALPEALANGSSKVFHLSDHRVALSSGPVFKTLSLQPEAALDYARLGEEIVDLFASPSGDYAVALAQNARVLRVSAQPGGQDGVDADGLDLLVRGASDPEAPRLQITPFTRDTANGRAKPFGRIPEVIFSPDGRYFVTETEDSYELFDSASNRRLLSFGGDISQLAFDVSGEALWASRIHSLSLDDLAGKSGPAGPSIKEAGARALYRISLLDGDVQRIHEGGQGGVTSFHQSANGARIAVQRHEDIRVYERDGTLLTKIDAERVAPVAITPDGQSVLRLAKTKGARGLYTLFLHDAADGTLRREIEGLTFDAKEMRFSKDGQSIFLTDGNTISRVDLSAARVAWTVENLDSSADDLMLSDDGQFVSKHFRSNADSLLLAESGQAVWTSVTFVQRSSYDPQLTLRHGERRLWDLRTGLAFMDLPAAGPQFRGVFLTKDNLVLRYSDEGEIYLWRYWDHSADFVADAHAKIDRLAPLTREDQCAFNLIALEQCL